MTWGRLASWAAVYFLGFTVPGVVGAIAYLALTQHYTPKNYTRVCAHISELTQ